MVDGQIELVLHTCLILQPGNLQPNLQPNHLQFNQLRALKFSRPRCFASLSLPQFDSQTKLLKKQGRIHGNLVADGWAGAVMQKPLAILEIFRTDGPTDRPTRQGVESHVRDQKLDHYWS